MLWHWFPWSHNNFPPSSTVQLSAEWFTRFWNSKQRSGLWFHHRVWRPGGSISYITSDRLSTNQWAVSTQHHSQLLSFKMQNNSMYQTELYRTDRSDNEWIRDRCDLQRTTVTKLNQRALNSPTYLDKLHAYWQTRQSRSVKVKKTERDHVSAAACEAMEFHYMNLLACQMTDNRVQRRTGLLRGEIYRPVWLRRRLWIQRGRKA